MVYQNCSDSFNAVRINVFFRKFLDLEFIVIGAKVGVDVDDGNLSLANMRCLDSCLLSGHCQLFQLYILAKGRVLI